MGYRFRTGLRWSDVTPRGVFMNRRQIILAAAAASVALPAGAKMAATASRYSTSDTPNTLEDITSYNNYYEFGTAKADPAANAGSLVT